jgi:hypothetical protein
MSRVYVESINFKLKHGKDYWSYFDGGLQDELRKELFLAQHTFILIFLGTVADAVNGSHSF